MTVILDGKKVSSLILEDVKKNISNKKRKLATILVGDNYASELYVNIKKKRCESVGMDFELHKFNSDENQDKVIEQIKKLNDDESVTGILVQLPLPISYDTRKVLDSISPTKDVDGLTSSNLGLLMSNKETIVSCTAKAVITLLDNYNISSEGKHVVIIGHSFLVGRPLAEIFLNRGATVTVCHDRTNDLEKHTQLADILVSATGVSHLIKKEMVKQNTIVVDVGISKKNGKLCGDVDFENVKEKSSFITPVPGGIGPMTVAMLVENLSSM
jgi:methylenetetrahydrofolate dehydrogenase (NADP+)/methenyltetrahydrofolate cyclohydrolase